MIVPGTRVYRIAAVIMPAPLSARAVPTVAAHDTAGAVRAIEEVGCVILESVIAAELAVELGQSMLAWAGRDGQGTIVEDGVCLLPPAVAAVCCASLYPSPPAPAAPAAPAFI